MQSSPGWWAATVATSDCVDGEDGAVSKDAAQTVHVSSPANVFDAALALLVLPLVLGWL